MKNLKTLFLLFALLSLLASCGDDEEELPDCPGITFNGGSMQVDGEDFPVTSVSQLNVFDGNDVDDYSFQVSGVSSDCFKIVLVSFRVQIAPDTALDGTYPIQNLFNAEINDAFGVAILITDGNTSQTSLIELNSGMVVVDRISASEYDVVITGTDTEGNVRSASFRSSF